MLSGTSLALIVVWPAVGSAAWLLVLGTIALMIWSARARSPRSWNVLRMVALGFALVTAVAATWALVRMLFFSSMLSDSGGWVPVLAAVIALVAGLLIARALVTSRASPTQDADESAAPRRRPELLIAGALSILVGLVLLAMLGDVMRPPCSGTSATGPAPSLTWEREAAGRSMPLAIVGFDGASYPLTRKIRIDVDTWDLGAESAVALEADGLAVVIEGTWVPGSFTIQSRRERGETLALVLVVAGDERLGPLLPAIGEGLDTLVKTLAPTDTVRVWIDSDGAKGLRPPSPGPAPRAADPIGAVVGALEQVMRLDAELPAARHILLIANGHPEVTVPDKKTLDDAIGLASTLGVRVDAVAIESATPAAAAIEALALRTTGTVRWVLPSQGGPAVHTAIASYGRELASRSIITFSPTDYCGEDQPARFELAARSSDGRFARDTEEDVKIPGFPLD